MLEEAQFTNVSNIGTITAAADKQLTGTIGTKAAAAGITQINLVGDAASDADSITVAAGFTNNLTIDLDGNGAVAPTTAAAAVFRLPTRLTLLHIPEYLRLRQKIPILMKILVPTPLLLHQLLLVVLEPLTY